MNPYDVVEILGRIYRVPIPRIKIQCWKDCPEESTCIYQACYKWSSNTLNFREVNPDPATVAHEMGHYIYHMKNGIRNHRSLEDALRCEEFARLLEAWWILNYGSPQFTLQLATIVASTIGVTLGTILLTKLIEYVKK